VSPLTRFDRICVFAGSSPGARPEYAAAAAALGALLAKSGITVVFGGGSVGLMGVTATAALEAGGEVIGIIPAELDRREVAFDGLTELHVVDSMHERKAKMADLAEAFILLPGGFGSIEEFVEVLTWNQLGIHAKPCGVLDVLGYWQPFLAMIDHGVQERFLRDEHRAMVLSSSDPVELLEQLTSTAMPAVPKWLDRSSR